LADVAALTEIVEPEAQALGFALVRVALFGAGSDSGGERTLQIMAERPETRQLTIDDCAALSRRISDKLDALEEAGDDPIEGAYRLEVSSPGIDRPLTRLSDFADWAGHEARVQLRDPLPTEAGARKSFHGTLDGVEHGTVAMTDRKSGAVRFAFDNIASAKLVLTDKLLSVTRPLDTSGAEEEEFADPEADSDLDAEYLSSEQDQ
jgi:ribosome maturation factor RimP